MSSNDELHTRQTHKICAEGISSEIDNKLLQSLPYDVAGFSRWVENLSKNEIIYGNISDLPKLEKETLENQGVKSILVIPIFENKKWTGFIGFDVNNEEREWKEEDIRLLRTVGHIIGLYTVEKKIPTVNL